MISFSLYPIIIHICYMNNRTHQLHNTDIFKERTARRVKEVDRHLASVEVNGGGAVVNPNGGDVLGNEPLLTVALYQATLGWGAGREKECVKSRIRYVRKMSSHAGYRKEKYFD